MALKKKRRDLHKRNLRRRPKRAAKSLKKKTAILKLHRIKENPILAPLKEHEWESWQTFNPAAILLEDKVRFIYRAIGNDGLSRFGYAVSDDGFKIKERLIYPVYEHRTSNPSPSFYSFASGGSFGGCEDPRIIRVNNEDCLYMTYTSCNNNLRVALTSIKINDFLNKKWKWKKPIFISAPGENHKNWIIFPEKINGKYAILHSINPEISIAYVDSLDPEKCSYVESCGYGNTRREGCWDNWIRGAGPPPIKTKYGWLLLYHAMDKDDPNRYKVGAMLLDLADPTKILYRSQKPILEPDEQYENEGFKAGVVYASGAVVKDSELLVYYGGADSYVCVAYANFDKFLEALKKHTEPKISRRGLKKSF